MSMIDPTTPIKAPDLPDELLRKQPHASWLEQFSASLQVTRNKRGGIVTPFLEGAITRLQWASRYIKLLQSDLHWLSRDNKLLRKHIEHLGGVPAPPFRPDAESAAEADAGASTDREAPKEQMQ